MLTTLAPPIMARLTGRSLLFQRMRSGNGIALSSVVNGKQEVMGQVCGLPHFTITLSNKTLALYIADKLAHDEAIRNGGVSFFLLHSDYILMHC